MDQGTVTLVAAFVAAGASLGTAFYANMNAREERRRQTGDLMAKYHEPLLRSAQELQSRLWNILCDNYLGAYYKSNAPDAPNSRYAVTSTMYAAAEYFCWREIVRRDVPYVDLGDAKKNRELVKCLDAITDAFASDKGGKGPFLLFRHEQRAMGEVMMVDRATSGPVRFDCIGFAEFTQRLEARERKRTGRLVVVDAQELSLDEARERKFARWFARLEDDVLVVAKSRERQFEARCFFSSPRDILLPADQARLVKIQNALIDLLNLLDPNCAQVQAATSTRIKVVTQKDQRSATTARLGGGCRNSNQQSSRMGRLSAFDT